MISWERFRQEMNEHFSAAHDDTHRDNELALAAATYALPVCERRTDLWPWDEEYFKPTPDNRIRELVKAGALICAEIDRLKRQKQTQNNETKEN